MTLIMRHRWTWTGFQGQPGFSNFFGLGTASQAFADGIRTFLVAAIGTAGNGALPSGVAITPDSFVDIINDTTGFLDSSQAVTPPAAVTFAGGTSFASVAGICVTWATGGFATGPSGRPRRVRGRTFLIPISGSGYDTDGTLVASRVTAVNAAAAAYVGGSWNPCVWHRPTGIGGVNGSSHRMTGGQTRDKVAILTSRRD